MFHLPRCQSISLLFTDLLTTLLNHLSNTSLLRESKNQQAGAMLLRWQSRLVVRVRCGSVSE